MLEWKNLVYKRELTDEELKSIPSTNCSGLNIVIKYFNKEKNISNNRIIEGMSSEKIIVGFRSWTHYFNEQIIVKNILKSSPDLIKHKEFIKIGKYFISSNQSMLMFFIKITSFKTIINGMNKTIGEASHTHTIKTFSDKKGIEYITVKKLPFFDKISSGYHCRFGEGVFEGVFEVHKIEEYKIKHLICEEKIEDIIKKFYKYYRIEYRETKDKVFLNNILVGKKVCLREIKIGQNWIFTDEVDELDMKYNAVKFITDFRINGITIFEKGEIYNAPHCCIRIEWKEVALINRIKNIMNFSGEKVRFIEEIDRQIAGANSKILQLNAALGKSEDLKRVLEERIMDREIELTKKNDEIKVFLGKVSHELRTPLNAIIGYSKILIAEEKEEEKLSKLNIVSDASEKLLKFSNEIITFSKLELRYADINYEKVSLVKIFEDIKQFNYFELQKRNIFFDFEIEKNAPNEIVSDSHKLFQAINNIVENAIKFTENGGIYISCKTNKREKIIIEISDTGTGISNIDKGKIFNILEKSDSGNIDVGLGLPISKMIVEAMNGEIKFESRAGMGSVCSIVLPNNNIENNVQEDYFEKWLISIQRTEREKELFYMALNDIPGLFGELRKAVYTENVENIRKIAHNMKGLTANFQMKELCNLITEIYENICSDNKLDTMREIRNNLEKMEKIIMSIKFETIPFIKFIKTEVFSNFKVLLAEDNEINQNLVRELLAKINIQCDVAENGAVCLEKLKSSKYNVVLLDIEMPVMNGEETIKRIRKNKNYSELRVVALTATTTIGSKEKYIGLGFDDYISKPINEEILYRLIKIEQNM